MLIAHLDIETTGKNAFAHGIHHISSVIEIDGETIAVFDRQVRPQVGAQVDPEALKVCNIKWNEIRNYDNMDVVFADWIKFIRACIKEGDPLSKLFLAAYNAGSMEVNFMREWYRHNQSPLYAAHFHSGFLDTMSLATNYLGKMDIILANYSLSSVANALQIEVEKEKLHLPAYDVYLSRCIYNIVK